MNSKSSYRPHDPGHDYYAPGVYLVTLVVRNRESNYELLGRLNGGVKAPAVVHTEIGKAVVDCWHLIPEIQARHGRKLKLHAAVCMPDHFHGVIEVLERMDKSVGEVNGVPAETDYSIFHNLNRLAEEICAFDGEARMIYNEK